MWPEASKPVSVPEVKRLGIPTSGLSHERVVHHKQLTMIEANSIPQERQFRCLLFAASEHPATNSQIGFVKHTCRSEDKFGRTEPVRIVDGDREPDEAEEKVEHEDEHREAEYALVPFWREVIDRDRHD